jgi:hypothetical protein
MIQAILGYVTKQMDIRECVLTLVKLQDNIHAPTFSKNDSKDYFRAQWITVHKNPIINK